jgi:mono/diheme cytochrome c family protein
MNNARRGLAVVARIVLAGAAVVLGGTAVACESAPRFAAPMVLGGVEVSAETLNQGARVYEMRCASCHGVDGSGNGSAGRALKEKPRDFRTADFRYKSTEADALPTDADLLSVVENGRIEEGMPAWSTLTPEDRHAVVQYIKTFSPRWHGNAEPPAKERG